VQEHLQWSLQILDPKLSFACQPIKKSRGPKLNPTPVEEAAQEPIFVGPACQAKKDPKLASSSCFETPSTAAVTPTSSSLLRRRPPHPPRQPPHRSQDPACGPDPSPRHRRPPLLADTADRRRHFALSSSLRRALRRRRSLTRFVCCFLPLPSVGN
jgi:hypothetical protein